MKGWNGTAYRYTLLASGASYFWPFEDGMIDKSKRMTSVGFEPTPTKTTALTLRLRPLGHDVDT